MNKLWDQLKQEPILRKGNYVSYERAVDDKDLVNCANGKDVIKAYMSMLGQRGGPKGGAARAIKLSSERRREIAQKAAQARWLK